MKPNVLTCHAFEKTCNSIFQHVKQAERPGERQGGGGEGRDHRREQRLRVRDAAEGAVPL